MYMPDRYIELEKLGVYNPYKLLYVRNKDLDGELAGIYICITNRSAGKTTNMYGELFNEYIASNKKSHFMTIVRSKGDLDKVPIVLNGILKLLDENCTRYGKEFTSEAIGIGHFHRLYLDGIECGYAVALRFVDKIKDLSPGFSKIDNIIFDEMMPEESKYYLKNEVGKLQSLIISVARGNKKQSRYVRTILIGNPVTIMNPYYINFGIYNRLKSDTKFLRGAGWVGEFTINESAKKQVKENLALKAFRDTKHMAYASDGIYLKDDEVFIEKPKGSFKYVATMYVDNRYYGMYYYRDVGILYITKKYLKDYPHIFSFHSKDHNTKTKLISKNSYIYKLLKDCYADGSIRFDSVESKKVTFDILAVDIFS